MAFINGYFFNELDETKSSMFLKVVSNQNSIEMNLFERTRKTLNCTPKTMKVKREIQQNLLCIGKRKKLITKKNDESKCF